MNHHSADRGEDSAEHVDQSDQGRAEAGHVADDLIQHAGNRHRRGMDHGGRFPPAHFVDQARIVRRKPGDPGLDGAMGEAAAKPFDQPGPEGVEFGDLRHIDEDVGPASGQPFGVRHHLLKHRRKAGGTRTRSAQRQSVALCNPLQCRVAVHDANSCADSPLFMDGKVPTAALWNAPLTSHTWLRRASRPVQKLPDFKMTSTKFPKLAGRIERWPIAGSFTISRGAKTEAVTGVAGLNCGGRSRRGGCAPHPRYGETPETPPGPRPAPHETVAPGPDPRG